MIQVSLDSFRGDKLDSWFNLEKIINFDSVKYVGQLEPRVGSSEPSQDRYIFSHRTMPTVQEGFPCAKGKDILKIAGQC